ncbi:MAG: hypothetical protein LBK58_12385 [Prevotellaceae bacterium]|nr:hypothetical protein [Prevotellaceae bacterium]
MANNGIIDQIVSQSAIDSLDKLKKELADNSAVMKNLSDEAQKLNGELNKISTLQNLIPLLAQNKALLDATTAAERERIRILNQIQTLEARETALQTAEAKKLEELRQQIAGNNRELRNQVKEQNAAAGSIEELRAKLNQMTKAYDAMSASIRKSDAGKQAAKDIRKLSDELKELEHATGRDQRNVGNYFDAIKKGLAGLGLIVGAREILIGLKDVASEAIDIAAKAEGITTAFEKLNDPHLLENLRAQTKGTVSDLDLMTAAVRADMFKIPADQLGTLLKFAQQRAQETGESIDHLTESIITGLGRKSALILDNLGISASELQARAKETGDFVGGAIGLINEELEKQGDLAITVADRQQQASVKWENAMLHVGGKILWIGDLWSKVSGMLAGSVVKIVDLLAKYGKQIVIAGTAIIAYTLYVKRAAIAQAAWNAAVNLGYKLAAVFPKLSLLWGAAVSLLTGNIRGATYAWQVFTKSITANPIGLFLSVLAGAVVLFSSFTSKANESTKAMSKFNDELSREKAGIDDLFGALKKTNAGTDERRRLIDEINSRYGQYLKNQLTEKSTLEEIEAAQKNVTKAMAENLAFKAQGEQIAELQKKVAEANESVFSNLGFLISDFSESEKGRFKAITDQLIERVSNNDMSAIDDFKKAYREAGGKLNTDGGLFSDFWRNLEKAANEGKKVQEQTKKINAEWQSYLDTLFPESSEQETPELDISREITAARQNVEALKKELDDLRAGKEIAGMSETFEATIAEREKALKDAEKILETLTGEKNKSDKKEANEAQKEADAAQKKIDEVDKRIKDVQKKINDLGFESISEPLKKIADDEEKSLQQRLEALQQYYDEKRLMRAIQDDTEETGIDAKIFEAKANRELELAEKLETEKTAVVKLHALEREKMENEYQKKIDDIQEKYAKKEIERLKGNIGAFQEALEMQQIEEEKRLFEQYRNGKISKEKYEEEKYRIQVKYSKQSVQTEIDLLKNLLNMETLSGEERQKINDEIRKLELKNEKIHLDDMQKLRDDELDREKKLADAKKQLQQEAWNFAETILSAQFEKQIQRYDAEIAKINERKDAEIEALEKSGKTEEEIAEGKMIIEARAEAQAKEIEKKKREMQIRQAKFEKAFAIAKATADGALGIQKTIASVGLPAAFPLIATLAGITALQIATILAQPIPQYAEGTCDHPGGPAILGDAYRKETVIEPSGRVWKSRAQPTLIPNLPKHSIVLPSADDVFKPDMRIFDSPHGIESVRAKAIELSFDSAVEKQTRKLANAIRESKSSLSVNLDSHGIYKISESGQRYGKLTGNQIKHGS